MALWVRAVLIALAVLAFLVVVGPFLVPIPPLEGTHPPQELAEVDSRFVDVGDLTIHYKTGGQGQPALVLLHGFGASLFSWREVMAPLSEQGTVVAFDRPAFGLTERPMPGDWRRGESPYRREAQAAQTVALMDVLGLDRAVLVGHSAGGTIALLTALHNPERVQALILVDAAVYTQGGTPRWVLPLLTTPQMRRLGPLLVRSIQARGEDILTTAWHDPSKVAAQVREGYRKPLQAQNWDRALWEFTVASRPLNLPEQLDRVPLPVLVITGDDDRIVPTEQSIRLAGELPNAELVVIPECGHVPHEECPELVMDAIRGFLDRIGPGD